MTIKISDSVFSEVNQDLTGKSPEELMSWTMDNFAVICMENPRLAQLLAAAGPAAMHGGSMVYELMTRQIRKDALAALERTR